MSECDTHPEVGAQKIIEGYARHVKEFKQKTVDIDYYGLDRFFWYHTIDLGNGIVTPGEYDYRKIIDRFQFPEDMCGMTVLDVGSATGFFSFEFVKRGAKVTSVELPSMEDWDMPSGEDTKKMLKYFAECHGAKSVEELYHFHLDGPFQFCREMLGVELNRYYSTVYDLSPEKLDNQQFDLVFIGDVLLHIFSPLQALNNIVPLCRGKLIISQTIPEVLEDQPVMVYLGGEDPKVDNRFWWYPNKACFTQMLKVLGFRKIDFVDNYGPIIHRPTGKCSTRTFIHAIK